MEEAIASIILNYARQHNVIDTGFIDKAAVELAGLFQSAMRDNIVLHESASNILSGIMANPATDDCYNELDVCNESVSLAHTLLTCSIEKIENNANQRVTVAKH